MAKGKPPVERDAEEVYADFLKAREAALHESGEDFTSAPALRTDAELAADFVLARPEGGDEGGQVSGDDQGGEGGDDFKPTDDSEVA